MDEDEGMSHRREEDRRLFGVLDLEALRRPQGPRSGVNAIIGRWPGDETDEVVARALRELS